MAALPADSNVRPFLAEPKAYPVGVVEPKITGGRMLGGRVQASYDLDLRGPTGPFFNTINLALDRQQSSLVGEDGMGVERFRVPLADNDPNRRALRMAMYQVFSNPAMNYAAVEGNELFLWMGHQIVALDTLRGKTSSGSHVLWSEELQTINPTMNNNVGVHPHRSMCPGARCTTWPKRPTAG